MLEELVSSLLYEGYALYPYTPGALKNATPTPFGIVYPPVYAQECSGAFDHARLDCVAEPLAGREPDRDAALSRSQRRAPRSGWSSGVELGPIAVGERATIEFPGGRFTLRSEPAVEDGRARVRACVHNTQAVSEGLARGEVLEHALISTHLVVQITRGRFISPLDSGHESVNTWPVLATAADDAVLGAAIVLPDHPQISPQSRGNLFDNTEIEEALVLHVHVLSDSERAQAAGRRIRWCRRCSSGRWPRHRRTSSTSTAAFKEVKRD